MSTTPTAAPPSWLEAAAKLDAVNGDKVSLAAARNRLPADDGNTEDVNSALAGASDSRRSPLPRNRLPADDGNTEDVNSALAGASDSRRSALPTTKSRITPPAIGVRSAATTEEVELAWHGYSAAALVPSSIALAAFTAVVFLTLRPLVPVWVMHEAADAPLAALWLLQAIRGCYRLLGYNYRLTNRRLFRRRGVLYPPEAPLDLATVVRAEGRQSWLGRLAGVGTVRVIPENPNPLLPPIELIGIRNPKALAARIEEAATAAREGNVVSTRLPGEPGA